MANLAPDYRWTLVQILRILSVVSVLVDAASCDACDERVSGPSLLQRHRDVEPRPSLAFCKTHKTGGSTLAGIFFRLAELHNLSIMMPSCEEKTRLGDPFAFPGQYNVDLHGPPAHQFDMILHHAILNASGFATRHQENEGPVPFGVPQAVQKRGFELRMSDKSSEASYLKPTPFFVSILREPKAQILSTYNFYRIQIGKWSGVKEYLAFLEEGLQRASKGRRVRQFINFQSHDLGFYEAGGMPNSTSSEVSEWIASLDKTFSFPSAGLMLITEYFDEGLALLKGRLNIAWPALTYTIQKDYQHDESIPYEELNHTVRSWVLQHTANVDVQLYHHFNRTFAKVWSKRGGSVDADLKALQDANAALSKDCEATPPGPLCEKFATSDPDNLSYANLFRKRQGLKVCEG